MPPDARPLLAGEVECYGRSVVNLEWPAMEAGRGSGTINPWSLAMFRTLQAIEPATAAEQSAYHSWLAQTSAREEARRDRLHAAEGVVPHSRCRCSSPGISTKLNSTRLRGVILAVGCVVFVSAASWIATFPISLSI